MNLQASIRIPRRAKDGSDGHTFSAYLTVIAPIEDGNLPSPKLGFDFMYDGEVVSVPEENIRVRHTDTDGNWYSWQKVSENQDFTNTGGVWDITDIGYNNGCTFQLGAEYKGFTAYDSVFIPNSKTGERGIPGQTPIQKEWVVGDVHRNTDEIVDYIYVRGADKNTSYWYKLSAKGIVPEAGNPPEKGSTPAGYVRIDWLKELAVQVLLAEEANVAGFIFKEGRLISVRGTVGGVDADYSGQAGFVPNLILDGTEGDVKITGTVNALGGTIGDLAVEPTGRIAMYMPKTTQSRLTFRATDIPTLTSLLNTTVDGGYFTAGAGNLAIPQTGTSTQTLTGSTFISQTGSTIEITGGKLLSLTCDFQGVGNASVVATLYLMRGSVKERTLASAFVMGSGIQTDDVEVENITLEGMQSGTYTLMLEISKVGTQLTSGNATVGSGVRVDWSFNREGVRNFLFGLNGFLSFFSNNHIYFTETTGLDVRGKTNMPGLLGSASIIGGQLSNEWGRITGVAIYGGGYRVTISGMTHDKYTVQITSHTTNQWRIGTKTSSNFIILGTGDCDIAIMGNNY